MRKLKLQVQVSIDAFVAGPHGEMDWMVWDWDQPLKDFVTKLTEPVDLILLGRKLAEGFIPTWQGLAADPKTADYGAHKMNDTKKIVFSKTLTENPWERTTIVSDDLGAAVTGMKAATGGDIIAYGGGNFVSNLIKENLVDDYYFFVNPVALGSGMTILKDIRERLPLKMVSVTGFDCGIVVQHYRARA